MDVLVVLVCIHYCLVLVASHARLLEPAGRSSMWRFGYNSPVNYNDNQLFCGGYRNTVVYDGKCGVCGDPFQGPYENEAGGRYATGTIVRYYAAKEEYINITVDVSAHHRGQFEFRICPNNDVSTRVTQECLDKYVLQIEGGRDAGIHFVPSGSGIHHMRIGIPRGLTCSQCVLQWKYTTGNFWGVDKKTGRGCIGCGDQERFVNCADIAIGNDTLYTKTNRNKTGVSTYIPHTERSRDHGSHYRGHYYGNTSRTYPSDKPEECNRCYALPTWQHFPDMDNWCDSNCKLGNCPPCRCYCGCPKIKFDNPCIGKGEYDTFDKMAGWCWRECCESECPIDKCVCSQSVKYPSTTAYEVQQQVFDHPLRDLFPGSNGHQHSHSQESSSSNDDDDSYYSVDNEDESKSVDHSDHVMSSALDVNIKPPGEALTKVNILADLVRKHWIRLPGAPQPETHSQSTSSHEIHFSNGNQMPVSRGEADSEEGYSSSKGGKLDTTRFDSFVLSEVQLTKVNRSGNRQVMEPVRPNGNFLSRFTLKEVRRSKVNTTSNHDLTVSLPQLVSIVVGDQASQGKASHPRHSPKLTLTKSESDGFPSITTSNQFTSVTKKTFNSHIQVNHDALSSLSIDSTSTTLPVLIESVSRTVTPEPDLESNLPARTIHDSSVDNFNEHTDGSLTVQMHRQVEGTTASDESVLPISRETTKKQKVDFVKKMAVDPRLLSSVLDLQPSLHQFFAPKQRGPVENHNVPTVSPSDTTKDKSVPEVKDQYSADSMTKVYNSDFASLSEVEDHTSAHSISGHLEPTHDHIEDHSTTESFRKDKHLLPENPPSDTPTTGVRLMSDNHKLMREISRNIHNQKTIVGNILREVAETAGSSPLSKRFTYHKLNLVEPDRVKETTSGEAPYVIDARLLNKILNTVQSWFNHPMYVVDK